MLPLRDRHVDLGADFVMVNGGEMPNHYGDIDAEYRAVKDGVGLFDRSNRGKVRAVGADCLRFLHGMVTNTVEGLAEYEGNYSAIISAQGQTLLDVWVHRLSDCVWLETEIGYAKKLMETLDRYLIADDVTLSDESDVWSILGVQGPMAHDLICRVLGDVSGDLCEHHIVECSVNNIPVWVTARSFTGEGGYDLRIEQAEADVLWQALYEAGGLPVGWQVREILRIEAGLPRYGVEIDESAVPLEAGLMHAVDFDKGCYIGQETIAKMHFRGQPRRYLVGLLVCGDAAICGNVTVDAKVVGRVTSCVKSRASGQVIALAILRRGYHEPGQKVMFEGGVEAEVTALPFESK
ncbi:MAG: aminomethyltransferase family protein [Candidatus Latescibacteria bacterium]|nr:aminomethyltransferase family protein [Candidatus Latescibacterota bacterium]